MIIHILGDSRYIEIPFDTLKGICLDNLNLHRAMLENELMSDTSFVNSDLRGSYLYQAKMTRCDLRYSNIIITDLREADLSFADLRDCRALHTRFEAANLQYANLEGATIHGADFRKANLQGANMRCVGIESADFNEATFNNETIWPNNFDAIAHGCIRSETAVPIVVTDSAYTMIIHFVLQSLSYKRPDDKRYIEIPFNTLQGISLDNLNLFGALLEFEDISNSSFVHTDLQRSFFYRATMARCILRFANLFAADFKEVDLRFADLRNCNALDTCFENANLQYANLEGATISGADFSKANLQGANKQCIGIESANFSEAIFNQKTIWPSSFNAIEYGCIRV